jgi:hypothetical protein
LTSTAAASNIRAVARRRPGDPPRLATKRERFFECVFAAERNEYRFHLRAWTPEEAAEHLRAELGANGLAVRGELRVVDRRGRVLVSLEYEPPARVPRPASERG